MGVRYLGPLLAATADGTDACGADRLRRTRRRGGPATSAVRAVDAADTPAGPEVATAR
jgi:hypothetical protein